MSVRSSAARMKCSLRKVLYTIVSSLLVKAFKSPPTFSMRLSMCHALRWEVPLNSRCSTKWAIPCSLSCSSRVPAFIAYPQYTTSVGLGQCIILSPLVNICVDIVFIIKHFGGANLKRFFLLKKLLDVLGKMPCRFE